MSVVLFIDFIVPVCLWTTVMENIYCSSVGFSWKFSIQFNFKDKLLTNFLVNKLKSGQRWWFIWNTIVKSYISHFSVIACLKTSLCDNKKSVSSSSKKIIMKESNYLLLCSLSVKGIRDAFHCRRRGFSQMIWICIFCCNRCQQVFDLIKWISFKELRIH